ncbi:fish-egg lectin-like [Pimephales promelas]|uniref:fish-egg lectin-like n=1 Tax=Pimephales promelas TaxID=90988 RepID=UPI001955569B|nr:fish-egg lectin-like [Pimephales promelas]
MKVFQSILLLVSCQFLPTLALNCVMIRGNLKQIDAGSGSVVGVNNRNEAFVLTDNTFRKIGRSLKHISVGPAGMVGVNAADKIFKLQGGSFVQIQGNLKQVDAGGDQIISGTNVNDDTYCLNMDDNNQWSPSAIPWVSINGKLKYFSCGPYSCWGVNSADKVFILKNVSSNACSGSGFEDIDGSLSMIEVATDGRVFGVNYRGILHHRTGVTRSNPTGTDWVLMAFACPNGHKHVSFDLGFLWVVCGDGSIRKCTL